MSDFSVFMQPSVDEHVKYVASKRFTDAKGKPVEWEIKSIDADLDERIRKDCTKKVPTGKRGQYTQEIDTDKYVGKLCVACTVYPNLNDAELQDFYSVKSGEDLIKKLLRAGEYTDYKTKVMEVNGYDLSMDELVDEAKN